MHFQVRYIRLHFSRFTEIRFFVFFLVDTLDFTKIIEFYFCNLNDLENFLILFGYYGYL